MTILWSHFHKKVPSSLNSWQRYERVLEISQKFDSVSAALFSNSLDTIRSVQTSITQTIHAALISDSDNSDLDDLIERLESGIELLQQQASKFEVQRRHYFDGAFSSVGKLVELSALLDPSFKKYAFNILSGLAYNAKYSTSHLAELDREALLSPYPPLFDTLWEYDGINFSFGGTDIVNNRLGHTLLTSTSVVDTAASQDRSQTLLDFQSLAELVVNQSQHLVSNHLSQFAQLLYITILQFVEVHSISIEQLPKLVSELDSNQILELYGQVSVSDNVAFVSVFEKYISPSLEYLSNETSKQAIARAWIFFALGMLILYVPNIPVDPAIHQHVTYDRSASQKAFSDEVIACWSYLKSVFISPENVELEKYGRSAYLNLHLKIRPILPSICFSNWLNL